MIFSIIQKSQLGHTNRIDAEYYQPVFLELAQNLFKFKSKTLEEVAQITGGKRLPVGEIFSAEGIPYVRIVDFDNIFIDIDNIQLISDKLHKLLERYQIKNKDILLTIVGNTVGLIGYNQLTLDKINFTENCARIRTKSLLPEYLLIVLLSRIGQLQVSRERVGTAQPKLSLDRLRRFLVPVTSNTFQLTIKAYVDESLKSINESETFYSQAENLLLEELELKDFKPEDDLSFIVNFSDIKSTNRMDAEFFQPNYDKIIRKLKLKPVDILGNHFDVIKSKSFEYKEDGNIFVIQTKQLGKQFINLITEEKTSSDILTREKLPRVEDVDILFASMGVGSLGKTNIYYLFEDDKSQFTIDSTIRILRKKTDGKVIPEVLAVYFSSWVGQELIYKYIVGSSGIISIYDNYLKYFLVPIFKNNTQHKISDLVRRSHEARKKSKELLEEAKGKVEEMIEKGSN